MRIRGFSYFIQEHHLQPHLLKDCSVVIDGQNLYYPMYKNSNLPFIFGPECDRFAAYIRNVFQMFKRANLKCHIILKGGHENKDALDVHFQMGTRLNGSNFRLGQDYGGRIINPLLIKDTYKQVLDEMGFEYSIVYKNDVIEECIALAHKLSCPIISFNVQYCFSPVPYIPFEPGTQFDFDEDDSIKCGIFKRDKFLNSHKITTEKLKIFILLTDSHIFDEDTFTDFLRAIRIPLSFKKRYMCLLQWLHRKTIDQAKREIFAKISNSDQLKFSEQQLALNKKMLTNGDAESMAILYFTDRNKVEIDKLDPLWLEKGVCLKYVCISYINLYIFGVYKAGRLIEDYEADMSILLSAEIIKYAYDLLTNFNGKEIAIRSRDEDDKETIMPYKHSVQKPDYEAVSSVFENGWDNIKSLKLFEHFLSETFQSFSFAPLERAPADSRMLLIALVFFTRKKTVDVRSEVYSILLSYVILSVVKAKANLDNIENPTKTEQPILDAITDKASVTERDCDVAYAITNKFFTISDYELHDIFDRKTLHPLVEFQYCLQELNNLNILCGTSFEPTIYSKTYNATFVYKVLCGMESQEKDSMDFVINMLNPAATVLAFFKGLIEIYETILYEY